MLIGFREVFVAQDNFGPYQLSRSENLNGHYHKQRVEGCGDFPLQDPSNINDPKLE